MNTFVAWILILTIPSGSYNSTPTLTVIDNIASREQCLALSRVIKERNPTRDTFCVSVRKIK